MDFKSRYKYNPKTDMLGRGGFAIVYKAQDTLLNRTVALKFFAHNDNNKNSLIQEISRAISLEHPNLCRYYDANMLESLNLHGELEKTEVGVMEYIDSGDLKSFLRHNITYFNKLLIDVLEGLSYLHNAGIIHRDLKPQNILIKSTVLGPIAKITDFGISKHVNSGNTNASQLMGTIEYMAPEQFSPAKYGINGHISTNLDLWSFGLLVYELIIGETLFGGKGGHSSAEQVMSNILNDDIVEEKSKKLPEPYKRIIQLCVVKNASLRVQTASELIRVLKIHQENNEDITNKIKALRDQTDTGPGGYETKQVELDDTETRVIHLAGNETMVIEVPQFVHEDSDDAIIDPDRFNDQTSAQEIADATELVPDIKPTESIQEIPEITPQADTAPLKKPKTPQKPKQEVKTQTEIKPAPAIESRHRRQRNDSDANKLSLQKHKLFVPLIILVILVTASFLVFLAKRSGKIVNGKIVPRKIAIKKIDPDYDYAMKHFGDTTTSFLPKLKKAASRGNDSAMVKLANYYYSKKHYSDAAAAIQPLASKNNPEALKILGNSQYESGLLLYNKKDYKDALTLFNKSASVNNAKSECMIGVMYHDGHGVQIDKKLALGWYLKAANQENDVATFWLGTIYADGDGVKRDINTAKKCFNWVIKHGIEEATRDAAKAKLNDLNN
jgi:serine/threonine protein kinase